MGIFAPPGGVWIGGLAALVAVSAARRAPASENPDERRQRFETEALPHMSAMYAFALRLTRNPGDAEDLLQEAFLRAYRFFDHWQPGTNLRAWLLTILRNTFINDYRREKTRGPTVDISEAEGFSLFEEVGERDPEGRFFDRIVDDEVLRAIDQLPEEFRETLVLSDVEGLPYQEIGKITGVPVGTVKSRLFRARKALQGRLYRYAVDMGYIKRRPE